MIGSFLPGMTLCLGMDRWRAIEPWAPNWVLTTGLIGFLSMSVVQLIIGAGIVGIFMSALFVNFFWIFPFGYYRRIQHETDVDMSFDDVEWDWEIKL